MRIVVTYAVLILSIGVLLYHVELGPTPRPRTYFVSYVYHCEENGPVPGYGYGNFQGPAQLDAGALRLIQQEAVAREQDLREETGLEETIRSLSLISVQRL